MIATAWAEKVRKSLTTELNKFMLLCEYCRRRFFDGEVISIEIVKYTEHPYHQECLREYIEKRKLLQEIFGEYGPVECEWFTRTFWERQVTTIDYR